MTPLAEAPRSPRRAAAAQGGVRHSPGGEFLALRLGSEEYGIDIQRVQEIRSYEEPTRVANLPEFVKGVLNLRGVIVPIVDLRLKLGCARAKYDSLTAVVVLDIRGRAVGAVVDSVSDMLELHEDQVEPAPALAASLDAAFITGIGAVTSGHAGNTRMLTLLDIEALMGSADLGLSD